MPPKLSQEERRRRQATRKAQWRRKITDQSTTPNNFIHTLFPSSLNHHIRQTTSISPSQPPLLPSQLPTPSQTQEASNQIHTGTDSQSNNNLLASSTQTNLPLLPIDPLKHYGPSVSSTQSNLPLSPIDPLKHHGPSLSTDPTLSNDFSTLNGSSLYNNPLLFDDSSVSSK